ncbi:MAG: DUF998 domain-containing protein [Methanobacteriaceae archaeon]|jgi:hypothetical protein|nr:DUF998 domain-containing protein [Candidatus Methanorudis spinitermitis]
MKIRKYLLPLGMICVISYLIHLFLGQFLQKEYNPITTDISSLTATGAPNAELLGIFTLIYGICFFLFCLGMLDIAFEKYHKITKIGFLIFMIMSFTSLIGYFLFPLSSDKLAMNFQNIMHYVITGFVTSTTIASLYFIGYGYLKKEKLKKLGKITIATASLIIFFGFLNPIAMSLQLNILGFTERLVIFTLLIFTFCLSFIYSFNLKPFLTIKKINSNKRG